MRKILFISLDYRSVSFRSILSFKIASIMTKNALSIHRRKSRNRTEIVSPKLKKMKWSRFDNYLP